MKSTKSFEPVVMDGAANDGAPLDAVATPRKFSGHAAQVGLLALAARSFGRRGPHEELCAHTRTAVG